ncbi:MAG: hypothetical protein FWE20_02680 [Defluviitaleaceae bacterium]|nr:hypothetical protein [Defluviitaleaceae bacterium]
MTENERKSLRTLISEREELAYRRLCKNPGYMKICERQSQTEEVIEEIYHKRFNQDELLIIRRHYEGETEKSSMEEDEVYFQGLRDCFQFILHLGILAD